ncbi:MAG TPA: hypothetical protein VNU46_08850 [Gemmatimonadaceae bacterium]|jgi:hypothetical protein|nr:hypothetical protein [Gemmatimonadaceae bacterium]
MNARQANDLAMLKRVNDFVTSTPPAPPLATPPAALPQLITQLQDAITKADTAASTQGSGSTKITTTQRAALRRTLRTRYLIPIRHIARVLSKTTPGLDDIVQLPKKVASEAALLAAAKATVIDVTPYQAAFVAKGLAPDFITQLNAAIAAVEQAADTSMTAQRQKITATADLQAAITDGRDTVISIGHVVQTACDQDKVNGPATRTAWDHIQHVHGASAAPLSILAPSAPSTTSSDTTSSTVSTSTSSSVSPTPSTPTVTATTASTTASSGVSPAPTPGGTQ